MPQVFHPAANTLSKISIAALGLLLAGGGWLTAALLRSPYATQARVVRHQPIPFSHKHHVDQIGLDCRYCHTTVEESSFAGMPATETCMGCHSQIWSDSPMLAPVRNSLQSGEPLEWTRVHDLPDFAYFDHSIHVGKGIGCSTCHGRVDQMPLAWREATLHMDWCLQCHRHPEVHVREQDEIFTMPWPPASEKAGKSGAELVRDYDIEPAGKLTNCSICHR